MSADTTQGATERSQAVFKTALGLIPGGTNSPLFVADETGHAPLYIARAVGCTVVDIDGNAYIDYTCARGALILGHADERVVVAIDKAASKGFSYGLPTESEVRLAELIVARVEGIKLVRLVNSATEAVLGAIRAARALTGRETVVRFEGCYHGPLDGLIGPASPTTLAFNDLPALKKFLSLSGPNVAAVLVEPVPTRMGLVPPGAGYLQGLRELCDQYGSMLIFDESVTGFRVGPAGASAVYGVIPDLFCYGAIVGGGLSLGAFGGRRDAMLHATSVPGAHDPGALGGNPLAIAAGITTLQATIEPGFYEALEARAARLEEGLRAAAGGVGVKVCHQRVGSMICTFFTDGAVTDYSAARLCDGARFARYRVGMMERGVLLSPSPYECMFICAAHGEEEIDRTIEAAREAFRE